MTSFVGELPQTCKTMTIIQLSICKEDCYGLMSYMSWILADAAIQISNKRIIDKS